MPWKFCAEIYNLNFKKRKPPKETKIYQTANLFFLKNKKMKKKNFFKYLPNKPDKSQKLI